MSATTIIPLLVVLGYHLLAHTTWGERLFGLLGLSNPLAPSIAPPVNTAKLKSDLLSEVESLATSAAKKVIADAASGNVPPTKAGVLAEMDDVVATAAKQAVADLKQKVAPK